MPLKSFLGVNCINIKIFKKYFIKVTVTRDHENSINDSIIILNKFTIIEDGIDKKTTSPIKLLKWPDKKSRQLEPPKFRGNQKSGGTD